MRKSKKPIKCDRCPLCDSQKVSAKYTLHFNKSKIFECKNCTFAYRSERDLQEWEKKNLELGFHYDEDLEKYDREHFPVFYNYLSRFGPPIGKSLLDVGCARGSLLKVAEKFGFSHISGMELSTVYAEEIRKRHTSYIIYTQPINEAKIENGSFDCITCIDVLEHMAQPKEEILQIYDALKPGGKFIAVTGNFRSGVASSHGSDWEYHYTPGHINFFNPGLVISILKSAGFKKITIQCSLDGIFKRYTPPLSKLLFAEKLRAKENLKGAESTYFNEYSNDFSVALKLGVFAKRFIHLFFRFFFPAAYRRGNGMLIIAQK